MQKEAFKKFVQTKPNLVKYVTNGKMTWQQFYEIYDLYGENNSIWDTFTIEENNNMLNNNVFGTIKDLFGLFKGIDLNAVQKTLTSLDKAIDAFKGLGNKEDRSDTNNYEERPKYKYFED